MIYLDPVNSNLAAGTGLVPGMVPGLVVPGLVVPGLVVPGLVPSAGYL